jgi:hypothetical protein
VEYASTRKLRPFCSISIKQYKINERRIKMKEFYSCEPKRNLRDSKARREMVEYDINTLIRDEAQMLIEFDESIDEIESDEEYDALIEAKAKEIKDELMYYGIYKNKYGVPLFLYC